MICWWDILEIPYYSDAKTIKKAYAKLLKVHNPEDDAEGYQRLRQAYDEAIMYSKKNNVNQCDNTNNSEGLSYNLNNSTLQNLKEENNQDLTEPNSSMYEYNKEISGNLSIVKICNEVQNTEININEQIDQFFYRLEEIYKNIYLRIDTTVWEELLNSDVLWNVESFKIIEDMLFNFLCTYKYLPAQIWTKLNNNFTWTRNEIKLYNKYSETVVDEILKNLKTPNKLKYDYVRDINPDIIDEYLYERQEGYEALQEKNYDKAYISLNKAKALFDQDPELLRTIGDYNYEFNHMNEALKYYKLAFQINNYDLECVLHIGKILVSYELFSEAVPYFKVWLSYNNNDKFALDYMSYCYYYSNDLIMARESFNRLLSFDENNKLIKKYLKNIEAKLQGKYVRQIKFYKDNLLEEVETEKVIRSKRLYEEEKEKKPLNINNMIRNFIYIIMIFVFFSMLEYTDHSRINYDNTKESKVDTNNVLFSNIITPKQFINASINSTVKMYLFGVKPIKYYKISEVFENRVIFSEDELKQNGLYNKVESQLYIGTLKQQVFIFSDSKCSNKNIDKSGSYELKGAKCFIDTNIENKIQKEYASMYSDYHWVAGGFIDASQDEINKAINKSNKLIK
ncbi:J domain-containing protein [Clostridium saccharoperbutylacetonicum]|uniref:J domain-containing protein n=1 Tax=Clostridium saccharoperbutylacetonicum TaxID=36745 RepID=UPI0039ED4C38